ncbi:hypothetical protein [Metabacillus arenae]|uniref:Uncharacterized protein n=1 Tax=Metabacillus arenae TaxID=2771434 RepID=A0A926NCQ5_9BACI|nr:hypothetical protein [Metabacillus arenae]MBD1379134.1 hypothetical protein [Metabacillus arenae]
METYYIDNVHRCCIKVEVSSYTWISAEVREVRENGRSVYRTSTSKIIYKPNFLEGLFGITYEKKINNGVQNIKEQIEKDLVKVLQYKEIESKFQ